MKLHLASCLHALSLAAAAYAKDAAVYLNDKHPSQLDGPYLCPETARLVFAQRLGVSQYHSLYSADNVTLDALNKFGASQRSSIFASDEQWSPQRVIVFIEGVDSSEDVIPAGAQDQKPSFTITDPPDIQANGELLSKLAVQGEVDDDGHYSCGSKVQSILGTSYPDGLKIFPQGNRAFVHITELQNLAKAYGVRSSEYKAATATIRKHIDALFQGSWDLTLVLMPYRSAPESWLRTRPSSYGTFSMPSHHLLKRQAPQDSPTIHTAPGGPALPVQSGVTGQQTTTKPATRPAAPPSTTSTSTVRATATNIVPPAGILRRCYTSQSSCESATHSCSGHGACTLVYDAAKTGAGDTNCYACVCTPSVQGSGNARKTTYWAGPACQKKDVSVQFWIFAGFTVGFLTLLSWTIGNMLAMGAEPLPGVLGSGVTGLGGRGK